jgi:hypothetical protein
MRAMMDPRLPTPGTGYSRQLALTGSGSGRVDDVDPFVEEGLLSVVWRRREVCIAGPMNAQRIYRTFRPHALDLAAMHDVPPEEVLLTLARAAVQCPPSQSQFETARYMRAQIEEWIVRSKRSERALRETG